MRTIQIRQFGGPEVLQLVDAPDPVPGPGQVVVDAHGCGVNPVDTYIRAGLYGPRPMPFTPGLDAAGVVAAVGRGVMNCRQGDRVYFFNSISGAYAQKVLCDCQRVYPLPAALSFEQGACVGVPGATAWRALFHRGEARAGQTVLIHGATGAVGTAAVQLGFAAGLTVMGTGGTEQGREAVRQLGATYVFDHKKEGYEKQILDLTSGHGVNLIIEMLANVNLDRDLKLLARFGKIIIVGCRGRIEIDPRQTMTCEADIRGMALFNASDSELRQTHNALYAAMQSGTYRPLVAKTYPLAEAATAQREILEPHEVGNLVLIP
jgi:NADPH2:quinone reductase